VASRQEEKEARRRERQERERKEAAATARRKRLQLGGGVLLGVAAIAAIVVAVVIATGSGDDEKSAAQTPASSSGAAAKLPEPLTTDYQKAADAAGCKLVNPPYGGAGHAEKNFKASDFNTNPPTSGTHFPDWYDDGVYEPGTTPNLGMLVHTLEHGRIDVQYKPGTPATTIAQLETFMKENEEGYHMLLFQNETKMPFAVAATAWDHQLGCKTMNDKVFDALRAFRQAYIDKGPEVVP